MGAVRGPRPSGPQSGMKAPCPLGPAQRNPATGPGPPPPGRRVIPGRYSVVLTTANQPSVFANSLDPAHHWTAVPSHAAADNGPESTQDRDQGRAGAHHRRRR